MKKSLLYLLLLPLMAVPALAQESRQDISLSGSLLSEPFASGNAVQLHSTPGYGGLMSYRYDLTPHGALEINFQYDQNQQHYIFPGGENHVHDRFMEFSGAYVYSFNFKNFNPFLEAGPAGFRFMPIDDAKTNYLTTSLGSNTNIGGMYGGGIAYEISPSFDIRAEYRGLIMKTPTFNFPNNDWRTNVYFNISNPVIGVAYHF